MRIRAVATVVFLVGIGAWIVGCGNRTAPTISTHPTAQTACSGSSVTFSVTASGTTPLSYQWQKDGTVIPGATSASYTIGSVAPAHAGTYTVVVTNKAGSVTSSPAQLTVNAPPTVTAQPDSQSACVGTRVLFTVTATGSSPLTYQWKKDGVDIPGATTALYTIPSVTEAHVGAYTVVVSNACGSVASTPAELSLQLPPVIATPPRAQTACQGQSVTLAVEATGTPSLAYQWKKEGADIPGATGPEYTIPSVSPEQAGTYSVTVTGACGTTVSAEATLAVGLPPAITLHPISQTASAGSPVTLTVMAAGSAPLAYQWQKDGEDIPGATTELYTLTSAGAGDAGTYTVAVINPCGTVVSNPAVLTVTAPFATVNGRPLSQEAFEEMHASIVSYFTRLYAQFGIDISVFLSGAQGRLFDLDLRLTALNSAVTRLLVEGEAARQGIVISPEAIAAEFERQYQAMLAAYGITEEFLVEYFAAQGGSLEEFKAEGQANVAEQLLYEAVQRAVAGPIELTDADLEKYFEDHKADYTVEEQVEASHILVATREEAQEILDQLAAGEDFAELARARSQDTGSASQGGQLGWFGRGTMVPPFEEAAFALGVGETSDIVETQFGFHIIRVTDRREAEEPTLAEVADRVRSDAEKAIVGERFDAWIKAAQQGAEVVISDPILQAMYLKDRDLDEGIAAFERIRDEGRVEEKYLSFIIGSLYEEKMAALTSEKEAALAQLPEGPELTERLAALDAEISQAREAALAAYRQALEELPDDEDVKEKIASLEGETAVPR